MDDQTGCRKNRGIPKKTAFPDNERPKPVVAGKCLFPRHFSFLLHFPDRRLPEKALFSFGQPAGFGWHFSNRIFPDFPMTRESLSNRYSHDR